MCVCPSIAACFAARLFIGAVHVYRTESKRNGIRSRKVWDELITGERWLVPPVAMVKVRVIPAAEVAEIFAAVRLYHQHTRRHSDLRLRLAQFALAIRALDHRPREGRLIARMAECWGIGDPEEYLLNRAISEGRPGQ